jgi:hypothetical protein
MPLGMLALPQDIYAAGGGQTVYGGDEAPVSSTHMALQACCMGAIVVHAHATCACTCDMH